MWNKMFNIPAYIATAGLFVYGLLGVVRGEAGEEGGASPMFFIILSMFLAMFIWGAKRSKRFHDKLQERDDPPHNP